MKKKFPIFRQFDSSDCGAACVKMITEYYGKIVSFEIIQKKCEIGKEGVTFKGICNALEDLDFKVVAGKITYDDLCIKAILPCILHWRQNHFVVLYKITQNNNKYIFYIADPGRGLIEYNEAQFLNNWLSTHSMGYDKGSGILLEPTVKFTPSGKSPKKQNIYGKNLSFLGTYLSKYKSYFLQLGIGLIVGSSMLFLLPFLTQTLVDTGIGQNDINIIWLIMLGQFMLILGNATIDLIRRWILLHISTRINISLISDFFIKLMRLPMFFFDSKHLGDILQRIEDHKRVERFITAQTLNLLFAFVSFIIFGLIILIYSYKIFIIFIVGSILYALWISRFLKKRRILDYKLFEQLSINQNKTYQLISGMQDIKLHNSEQRKRWEWEDTQSDLFDVNIEIMSLQQAQEIGSTFINELKNMLVTIFAATSVIQGEITLGMMLSLQYIVGQLNSPVSELMQFIYKWQDISISLERINDIHSNSDENTSKRCVCSFPESGRDIILENMYFKYPGIRDKMVLDNISLKISAGKTTAIVGASGSGKTTLIKLLLGYYEPTKGKILIGGIDINNINLRWWRDRCGVVMQNGYIFSDTIAGNIAVSENAPDIKKLSYAVKIANVDDFVNKLPLKYNTMVGDEGQGLSQGQKQRILIARAVYKESDYLFLDEATNSLDANNEKDIVTNLIEYNKGRTVIVVAHRLSTVKNADQIIVLDNGRIVERGTHNDLISQKGNYYYLVKNQLELGN